MTKEEAKYYIKNQLESYLENKGIDTNQNFPCLICGKGNKTPCMSYKNNRIHCFSCGIDIDLLDLISHETGKTGADLFSYCYDYYNITPINTPNIAQNTLEHNKTYKTITQHKNSVKTQNKDYKVYIEKCKENISKTDYFKKRGLSNSVIDQYNLGYDPSKKSVIIPYDKNYSYYITRHIETKFYRKLKDVKEPIYNLEALYNKDNNPVFVTEGVFDALSIIEVGGYAIALNGISYTKLLETLKNKPTENIIILSLDNDDAGIDTTNKLIDEFETLKIKYFKVNISGECKDPSDALIKNREIFEKKVQAQKSQILNYDKEKYISETSVTSYIHEFLGDIKESVNTPAIPTGFTELDNLLDDGLYEGLYILGAISSLGKTSFILQVADQIAQQGQDVLIFSLEMAIRELMAKSISRITFLECDGNVSNAKTTRGITSGKRHINYSKDEKILINNSIHKYATYSDYLYIYEGLGNIGVNQVRDKVKQHIDATGNKPVVIIDYLQILSPFNVGATDKQNTDKAVFELKRTSRDFKIPVIGISSLNRENYNSQINMSAFKESGAIEYSSDVLLGIQFEAISETLREDNKKVTSEIINKLKRDNPRKIELKILKNRNGGTSDSVTYDYYPMFNYFYETGKKSYDDYSINTINKMR